MAHTSTADAIAELRTHFPILREKTYLYSCSQGALSDAVERGMLEFAKSWRRSQAPWDEWMEAYEALRGEFAEFIGAEPEEVAIVTSASAGINPVANALTFEDRNRVVMSEYEFPTMGHIWLAQQLRGAQVEFLRGAQDAMPVERYESAIDERTKLVALTQVSFVNGVRPDVGKICKLAHSQGALMLLDGYQDCGTRPFNVKAAGVDFFVTGTLKYLLGPPGLAFLYVRKELIETLAPTITSWMAQRNVFSFCTTQLEPARDARRFEGGSPAIPNIYMARAALKLLVDFGLDRVAVQIRDVTRSFLEGARELGIEAKTPANSIGPLVVLRAREPAALLQKLSEWNIAASTRRDGIRFSFHVYNTMEDVAVALSALKGNLALLAHA